MKALALAALATLAGCASGGATTAVPDESPRGRTLVAVFAHPDDETIVSAALAHYAAAGARVYLVTATDGRKGANDFAGIPAGDSLAHVRGRETQCAARELGIQPPVLLGFEDAGLAVLSPWPGEPIDRLATRLEQVFAELKPDAVITWGPDGGYGHQDHRLVGDAVTQVFQAGHAPAGTRLYFVGYPVERTTGAPPWFGHAIYPVSSAYLTAGVPIDARDRDAARRALSCHKSQAQPADMDQSFAAMTRFWGDRITLQPWRGAAVPASGLF